MLKKNLSRTNIFVGPGPAPGPGGAGAKMCIPNKNPGFGAGLLNLGFWSFEHCRERFEVFEPQLGNNPTNF